MYCVSVLAGDTLVGTEHGAVSSSGRNEKNREFDSGSE